MMRHLLWGGGVQWTLSLGLLCCCCRFPTFSSWCCVSLSLILISVGIFSCQFSPLYFCCVPVWLTSHLLSRRAGGPGIILPSRCSKWAVGIGALRQMWVHNTPSIPKSLKTTLLLDLAFPPSQNCTHALIIAQPCAAMLTHTHLNPLRAGANRRREVASAAGKGSSNLWERASVFTKP